jgi:predicted transcriptional regulator
MDEQTINNNNQNDDDNYPFHRAEKILFELANADRLLIMCKLRDQKKNNLSKLARELGLVVQDVHRNVNRLLEAGLAQRDSTGYFSLTTFGDAMISELSFGLGKE